jgi:GDP-mannose 6-dehydrogenase
MRISIFGLGYVGTVTAGCLAHAGHTVVGVDIDPHKVALIAGGKTPVIEERIADLLAEGMRTGKLAVGASIEKAIAQSDVSLVCVGTPSRANGSLDLSYIERVCRQIGTALARIDGFHTVVVRSTVLPATSRDVLLPLLEEASGKRAGVGFGYCYNPEFLREGTAVDDFFNPPKTVFSASDKRSGERLRALYEGLPAPLIETDTQTAEMVKYTDNAWHALKIGFANEIGTLCKTLEIDSHVVMGIFCRDTKLNISSAYLRPGFAFGGSCLPKDVRALTYKGRQLDLELPILSAVLPSNELQIARACRMIQATGKRRIGIFGLSFKAGTDDLRESPMVIIAERLLGTGHEMRIYDKNLKMEGLRGANLAYTLGRIPHISSLLCENAAEVAAFADVVVICNNEPEHREILGGLPTGAIVIDFTRIANPSHIGNEYHGLCW